MKQIKVIGIGMGDEASMTIAARDWIRECDLLIGASRMVRAAAAVIGGSDRKWDADATEDVENVADAGPMTDSAHNILSGKECVIAWQPKDVWNVIRGSGAEKIAVLMSGDIGFFSGARALREEMEAGSRSEYADMDRCEYEISWLPGISSMAYFCSAVGIPYEDAFMLSIHGRSVAYIRQIAIHEKTFLLTDGDLPELGRKLVSYGLGNVTVWVGMDLAAPTRRDVKTMSEQPTAQRDIKTTSWQRTTRRDVKTTSEQPASQRIFKMTPKELAQFPKEDCRPLTVCLLLNPDAEKWRSPYRRDEEFYRDGKTPMTKEEVRGIILGKLMPANGNVIYDIGGGSGSVSVACAIAASAGAVYSVECDADAAKLIDENRHRFACDNIEIISGRAPEALRGLPAPDRVFIGGSGGKLQEILAEIEKIRNLPKMSAKEPEEEIGERNKERIEEEKIPFGERRDITEKSEKSFGKPEKITEKSGKSFEGSEKISENSGKSFEGSEKISENSEKSFGRSEKITENSEKSFGRSEKITEKSNDLPVCPFPRKTRVVISSITLETNAAVSSYIHTSAYVQNAEVCQLAVAKSKSVGGSTLMLAQNPVTVFSFDLA